MLESRTYYKTAFVGGMVAYLLPMWGLARFAWVRQHGFLALGVALLLLALPYWLYDIERTRRAPSGPGRGARFGLAFLSFLAGIALVMAGVLQGGHWRYDRVVADVDGSGLKPLWPADPPVDESDRNGQIILRRLAEDPGFTALIKVERGAKSFNELVDETLSAAAGDEAELALLLPPLRKYRAVWKPILAELKKARSAPQFSWNIRHDVPYFETEIPRLVAMQPLLRILAAEALLSAAEGNGSAAEDALALGQWLTDQVAGAQRSIVASMVAMAMQVKLDVASLPMVRRGILPKHLQGRDVERIQKSFEAALAAELFEGPMAARDLVHAGGTDAAWDAGILGLYFYGTWIDWDVSGSLRSAMEALGCEGQTAGERSACFNAVMQKASTEGWLLQSLVTPSFSDLWIKASLATARQRQVLLAVDLAQFRRKHGRWPGGSEELPALASRLDPFSARPFIVRFSMEHADILGVGADGREDVGQAARELDRDHLIRL